jgi:competence protein ComEA
MRLAYLLAGAALAGGVAFVMLRTKSREPVQILLPPPAGTVEIGVHVSGAVQTPGVYTLSTGQRVEDAVRAAGGATADADLQQVNLAVTVREGQQVDIPTRIPETVVAANPMAAAQPAPAAPAVKLNLNKVTLEELRGVAGIGDVRARRIIQSREQDGAYQDPVDLIERRILTPALYQRVRDTFTAP